MGENCKFSWGKIVDFHGGKPRFSWGKNCRFSWGKNCRYSWGKNCRSLCVITSDHVSMMDRAEAMIAQDL